MAQTTTELYQYINTTLPRTRWMSYYSQVLVGDYKYSARADGGGLGWLLCDGRSLQVSAYPSLYEVIGTTFGGSGCGTHFSLPDFRGRVHADVGTGPELTPRSLGDVVGEEQHTLTITEMPSHNHGGSTGAAGFGTSVQSIAALGGGSTDAGDNVGSHSHSISAEGGGSPLNVMQPTMFAGYTFIFTGVVVSPDTEI